MLVGLFGAAATGLGLMYFLDPDQGRRRRALMRDQMVHAAHKTGDAVDATSRDIANRAKGAVAELRGRFRDTHVSDDVLRERVRARIGAVIGHASAMDVSPYWDFWPAVQGVAVACLVTLLFTLPPLLGIRDIRPAAIFRRDVESPATARL